MRRTFSILALSLTLPLASAQDAEPTVNLEEVPSYQRGIEALADHLPEQAVLRLQEAYKVRGLTDDQNRTILMKLVEAQVRAGMADEALKTLDIKKYLDGYPGTNFWRGQALATKGEYRNSIALLSSAAPKDPFYAESMLTVANLSEAIGDEPSAIKYYTKCSKLTDKAIQLRASIGLAEIYLHQGDLDNAKKVLAGTENTSPRATRLKEYMQARIAYQEEKYAEAISIYRSLLDSSENVSKRIFDLTLLGIIDARHDSGDTEGATNEAIDFIKTYPQSTTLQPLLERITKWLDPDISESNPVLLQLRNWAGRTPNPNAPISPFPGNGSVLSMPPSFEHIAKKSNQLRSLAHFYYAQLLANSSLVNANERALFELSAFRAENPTHPLFADSILHTAEIELKRGDKDAALSHLASLQQLADSKQLPVSPTIKAEAAFIRGLLSIDQGNFGVALKAFEVATESTSPSVASSAAINAGLAALRTSNLEAFDKQLKKISDEELRTEIELEKALWLASRNHPEARPALQQFANQCPAHLRIAEARIALATLCISQPPLDPILCEALLETVNPNNLTEEQYTAYARSIYQLASYRKEWEKAAAIASEYLQKFPNSKHAVEFSMRNGLALYRNGEHNKARQILGKIAVDHPKNQLSPLALYYAAMAARLEGTPQAQQESVEIFKKVTSSKSPVALEARIQQARLLIDLNRVDEAVESLQSVYDSKANNAQQREIGIILAAALHVQGSTDSTKYKQAIEIYDTLLKQPDLNLAWNNQIHFLKGQALEGMGDQKGALDAYYSVINRENVPKGTSEDDQEWFWFYRCGFKALAMLENAGRPRAAIAIAKKIASYANGPRAQEAADRARNLEMKHMIWEE